MILRAWRQPTRLHLLNISRTDNNLEVNMEVSMEVGEIDEDNSEVGEEEAHWSIKYRL